MESTFIDKVITLKTKCRVEEELGRAYDLTYSEVHCIMVFAPGERISSGELSSRMALSPSRGSRVVKSLIKKGFLVGSEDKRDRRTTLLTYSAKGMKCWRELERVKKECEKHMTGHLSSVEVQKLREGLDLLLSVL